MLTKLILSLEWLHVDSEAGAIEALRLKRIMFSSLTKVKK
jgi:hypothetical protein